MKTALRVLTFSVFTLVFGCHPEDHAVYVEDEVNPPEFNPIINGDETNYESFKGAIAVYSTTYYYLCTGTLIAPNVVLTAGHCVYWPDSDGYVDHRDSPEGLRIEGGANVDVPASTIFYSNAAEVFVHPDWEADPFASEAVDLAILKLATPVDTVENYRVREAPYPNVGDPGTLVGYGDSIYNYDSESGIGSGDGSGVHRKGLAEILQLHLNVMEVGDPTSTCLGDSGGPFFTWQHSAWVVTGVTSYGLQENCPANKDGFEVNVLTYRTWIAEVYFEITGTPLPTSKTVDTGGGPEDTETEDSDYDPDDLCGGDCGAGKLTECTCYFEDPCEWTDDGECQDDCLDIRDVSFDDSKDCGWVPNGASDDGCGCSTPGQTGPGFSLFNLWIALLR